MFTSPFDQHRNYYFKEDKQEEYQAYESPKPPKSNAAKSLNVRQKLYHCEICLKGYISETEVESHKAKAHLKILSGRLRSGKNVCRACMRMKKSREKLIKHIKFKHLFSSPQCRRVERQIFICNDCNCLFFSKNMLIVHLGVVHKCEADMKCPKCFKLINRPRMYSHLELHCIQSVATCQICFTKLESRYAMLEHISEQHKVLLKCEVCAYETDKTEVFALHLESKHGQEVDFASTMDIPAAVVERCFVPQSHAAQGALRYIPVNTLGGLKLTGLISICILCREICSTSTEMREHVTRVHSRTEVLNRPTYNCSCGETFFHHVLLKHHLFKMKGHRQVEGLEPATSSDGDVSVVVEVYTESSDVAKRIVV